LYKQKKYLEAIKKIKKAIQKHPEESDNWVVWGLILKGVASYEAARHKFQKALKMDPANQTAQYEFQVIEKIIKLD